MLDRLVIDDRDVNEFPIVPDVRNLTGNPEGVIIGYRHLNNRPNGAIAFVDNLDLRDRAELFHPGFHTLGSRISR